MKWIVTVKLRALRFWLIQNQCRLRRHYWWVDEQGVRCARCGTPGW